MGGRKKTTTVVKDVQIVLINYAEILLTTLRCDKVHNPPDKLISTFAVIAAVLIIFCSLFTIWRIELHRVTNQFFDSISFFELELVISIALIILRDTNRDQELIRK